MSQKVKTMIDPKKTLLEILKIESEFYKLPTTTEQVVQNKLTLNKLFDRINKYRMSGGPLK